MIPADEQGHCRRHKGRNAYRRNGVRVEHLQQLNVRREDRDELALVPPRQPGGGQPPQGGEHLVADKRQKLESDKVVACLFGIVQHAARQRKHQHAGKYGAQRQRRPKA